MPATDFSAAQERVLARRQQREAAVEAALERDHHVAASRLRRLGLGGQTVETWRQISGRKGTSPAFRVGQVDAELLDEELVSLFKDQVGEALKYLGTNLSQDWSSEILLGLRAALFKLSIWDNDASYGASLQGLQYVDARYGGHELKAPSRWQKSAYGMSTVLGRYAWDKWEGWLIRQESRHEPSRWNLPHLNRLTSVVSSVHDIAALASFLVFLINGRYRTLTDRILRLRLVAPSNQISREVSFEYLNRQLVWHAFTEFLLFLLPLVGISRWRRWLARAWRQTKSVFGRASADGTQGELAFLPERTCAICYQSQTLPGTVGDDGALAGGITGSAATDITNPYEARPCGCVYCFVCLAERLEAEEGEGFACLRCGEHVTAAKPWAGDVVEEASRPNSSGKSVSFAEDRPRLLDPDRSMTPIEEEENRGDSGYGTMEENGKV